MILRMETHQLVELGELMARAPALVDAELQRAQTQATRYLHAMLSDKEEAGGLPLGAGGLNGAGLTNSIHTRVESKGGEVIGLVETSSPHASFVEFGTRPHFVPIQPLEDWALAKLPGVDSEEEARSAAFAISRKIAKHGTKPKPVWRTTFQKAQPRIRQFYQDAVARIVEQLGGG